jgi:hypothetical protein
MKRAARVIAISVVLGMGVSTIARADDACQQNCKPKDDPPIWQPPKEKKEEGPGRWYDSVNDLIVRLAKPKSGPTIVDGHDSKGKEVHGPGLRIVF